MAARKRRGTKENPWSEDVKARIRGSMLVNALSNHVANKRDMSSTQVQAALGLLRKVIPDLAASENKTEVTVAYVSELPPVAQDMDEWQQRHAPTTH